MNEVQTRAVGHNWTLSLQSLTLFSAPGVYIHKLGEQQLEYVVVAL